MSSAKKQKSISSFFTAKSPGSAKEAAARVQPNRNGLEDNTPLSPGENDAAPSTRLPRERKHLLGNEENDEPESDEDVVGARRPAKRRKESLEVSSLSVQRGSTTGPGQSVDVPGNVTTTNVPSKRNKPLSEKTSKYLFGSSSQILSSQDDVHSADIAAEDDRERQRKERLHQQFVKKLGQPSSLAGNWNGGRGNVENNDPALAGDELGEGDEDDEEGDEVVEAPSKGRTKSGGKGSTQNKGRKLTPLEKQILEIKRKHMDAVLVVEVGYKFRFFGEDARIAAKELSIVCIPGKFRYDEHPSEAHLDRFASASIPVHRLHVHVKRLIDAGHKVGVVRQLETAALKAAGDNRNAPFTRKLTNLYTKGTYIDEVEDVAAAAASSSSGASPTGYLLCITESNAKGGGTDEKVHVGILAVQPATGDVIYDDFEDGFMRSEIESRLLHIAPSEFLIVGELSKPTEKMIEHLSGSSSNVFGEKSRVERVAKPKTMAAQAYSHISTFYADKMKGTNGADGTASALFDKVLALPEHVTICLSAMITHLTEYGLEHVFDLTKYFQSFGARSHMLLNGNTLTSLEIYKNQTDHTAKGSLFWCLDRTRTRFGQRLLRQWVGRPLLDTRQLEERMTAVDELKNGEGNVVVDKLKGLLPRVKMDLSKSLIRIYYGKCTRPELLNVLQTLQRIANEFAFVKSAADTGLTSRIVNDAILSLPSIAEQVVEYLDRINAEAARKDDKYNFFREEHETDAITEHNLGIASVEHELDAHRAVAAKKAYKQKVDYVTVAGIEYLIEISNNQLKQLPGSWTKISGTKKVSRFHTPEVVKLMRERDQHKEALAAACDAAFAALLAEMSSKYQGFRDCVQSLAVLDCLLSLAEVAGQPGYVRPEYRDETGIEVEQGRHPMVEQLLLDAYVPNDIALAADGTRALLVTGPNMGGKSSYVRQVALIAIMAQIGSYVPASSARLGAVDAVFTRMGAFDNMMARESTFMVELSETSDMLKQATPRSLVILDELGRGTSTHDGLAIAQAVLEHVVRHVRCLTLFITHYQTLSGMARGFSRGELRNVHMRFTESGDDGRDVTFLYEVADGVAHRSYGLNVARLANMPASVIEVAAIKSKELEHKVVAKRLRSLSHLLASILQRTRDDPEPDQEKDEHDRSQGEASLEEELARLVTGIEQL